MILQSLVQHYEMLADKGKVTKPGWCSAKVSYAIRLGIDGTVLGIVDLRQEETRGKKTVMVPANLEVPQMVSRSSGVLPNFLCDNSKYLLGIDKEGSSGRVRECFESAKELHIKYLQDVHNETATVVKKFFQKWNPDKARECQEINKIWDEITSGGNLIFMLMVQYVQDDDEIRRAWNQIKETKPDDAQAICLVTGEKTEIARIHTTIKGVQGAQSSGAALVSFNAPAFESYGKLQSYNAPVGQYAAFAYTTALNHLLAQREFVFQFGDTSIVFWSEDGEDVYQDIFSMSLEPQVDNQETIKGVFKALSENRPVVVDDIELNTNQKFYILGLAPNAARLSVRFFYQNEFGNILENLQEHYRRMEVVKPQWDSREYLGVNSMLQETVNQNSKDKKPKANLAAATLQAVLAGGRDPESLYGSVLLRIRCEKGRITRGRAAVIKAYLLKNKTIIKEGDFVGLNENTNEKAYVLGRIFAVLEAIQEEANPGINTTIKDRYYNSASTTPASVFPILIRLKNSHIRKLEKQKEAMKVYYEKILTDLFGRIENFPIRLSLEEQGNFALGYYHQVQKRFEKKGDK